MLATSTAGETGSHRMSRGNFSEQANDGYFGSPGSPHLTFFWQPLQLSFVWNGLSEAIDVCHGGYGEPVALHLPAFVSVGTPADILDRFREHCVRWMKDSSTWGQMEAAGVVPSVQLVPDLLPL